MTEAEWLACTDQRSLLQFLEGRSSPRKLLLLACAWWRCVYGRIADNPAGKIVEVAEQIADGALGKKRLRKALATAQALLMDPAADSYPEDRTAGWWAARGVASVATERSSWAHRMWWGPSVLDEPWRIAFLRDVFGNPFRPAAVAADWLSWNEKTVLRLAQAIYDERNFNALPILADALEEAGCTDMNILAHCRGRGPHARGCWVIDRLLGKE